MAKIMAWQGLWHCKGYGIARVMAFQRPWHGKGYGIAWAALHGLRQILAQPLLRQKNGPGMKNRPGMKYGLE